MSRRLAGGEYEDRNRDVQLAELASPISGIEIVRARYFGRLRWPVCILARLITAGTASLAGMQYAIVGPVAFEIAFS